MMLSDLILPVVILGAYLIFVWYIWRETTGASWAPDEPATVTRSGRAASAQERVLFVCTHNSARSQMAEALLRHVAGERFHVASAGTAPTLVHPLAEQAMEERGLSLRSHRAKALDEMGAFCWDHVITVCNAAFERCPDFPPKTCRLHWSVEDPSRATGTQAQQFEVFRRVRDDLAERIRRRVADQTEKP